MKKLVFVFIVLVLMTTACGPRLEVVLPPNALEAQGSNEPVFVTLESVVNIPAPALFLIKNAASCPLYENPGLFDLSALPEGSQVRICENVELVQGALYSTVPVALLPAIIEPSLFGEAYIGSVTIGTRIVAVVLTGTYVAVEMAKLLAGDFLQPAPSFPEFLFGQSAQASAWSPAKPQVIPDSVLGDKATHAIETHGDSARCILQAANFIAPDEVFYSQGSPKQKVYSPNLLFTRSTLDVLTKLSKISTKCAGVEAVQAQYDKENALRKVATRNIIDTKMVLIVGQDATGYYVVSAYLVPANEVLFYNYLCSWNYTWKLYPVRRPTGCK